MYELQSGRSWMSCLVILIAWCGRGSISTASPILNIIMLDNHYVLHIVQFTGGSTVGWINQTVQDGIMQSTEVYS